MLRVSSPVRTNDSHQTATVFWTKYTDLRIRNLSDIIIYISMNMIFENQIVKLCIENIYESMIHSYTVTE
jgi:hypothetical protein